MLKEAVFHVSDDPYAFPIGNNDLKVRLKVKRSDLQACYVYHGDRYEWDHKYDEISTLSKVAWDENFDYFEGVIHSNTKRIRYQFQLKGNDQKEMWYGENGIADTMDKAGMFQFPYISEEDLYTIPNWVDEAVVYQILPDRFYNADPSCNPAHIVPWDEKPSGNSFYGGDLLGIIKKLDYLVELGINLIYLTPIFTSPSNHKYDTTDYMQIDPNFGDLKTAKKLVDQAHKRGIRVILDATFHHCSEHFFAFEDVMKKGELSRYKDWFYINSFPIVQSPKPNYGTFGFLGSMPKLKTHNKEVREYLLQIGCYWIEKIGIDGWRIDVANEIDHEFWRIFRKKIKELKPDALIIGEIWHNAGAWLRGDQFDGVTNYKFREAVHSFFARGDCTVSEFNNLLTKNRMTYSEQALRTMFNLLDSHDTERFLTDCIRYRDFEDGATPIELMKLTVLFQLTYIGIPIIYYGDEIGMIGSMDPDCRKPMIWDNELQNQCIRTFYEKVITLRKNAEALTKGSFVTWIEEDTQGIFGYLRATETQTVGIILNNSAVVRCVHTTIPWKNEHSKLTDLITGKEYLRSEQITLRIPPFGGMILL
ncbi:glycoside hydrolase family 13 protein [Anaerosporobacter faecicola]|uniref:glycoside hydrolase family 13 protein n=1 Tax=Anaerosporobacter faecicola TaxID=2718714 RepID=UPI00143C69CD|nr:glycoside hydrolase family 13 protein [Anaerosporobacter faecicola]